MQTGQDNAYTVIFINREALMEIEDKATSMKNMLGAGCARAATIMKLGLATLAVSPHLNGYFSPPRTSVGCSGYSTRWILIHRVAATITWCPCV